LGTTCINDLHNTCLANSNIQHPNHRQAEKDFDLDMPMSELRASAPREALCEEATNSVSPATTIPPWSLAGLICPARSRPGDHHPLQGAPPSSWTPCSSAGDAQCSLRLTNILCRAAAGPPWRKKDEAFSRGCPIWVAPISGIERGSSGEVVGGARSCRWWRRM
jgi:hypothetical protein